VGETERPATGRPGADGDHLGLVMRGVSAGYGTRSVVHGVSLEARPGEITGLIGPNGSGKTTLVRVASRGLRPTGGEVRLRGFDPYAVSAREAARLVAVVPQELTPAFEYSVLEIVLMGRSPYRSFWGGGNGGDWAQARRAMAVANVQHMAERGMGELSGGERQRTILAQALAQDASVLLLDEPTTHLDVRHVVEILTLVRDLARRHERAVLAIFHDLNLASAYCDRVYALSEGRVVAVGTPAEVITHELVRDVFGVEAEVTASGSTGRPAVVVAPPLSLPGGLAWKVRAHVIGGAGRGAAVLRLLAERGYEVTTGVLHAGDTDEAVAARLNLLRVTLPPFSGIDHQSAADCRELIAASSLLVVCDAPFGPGNVGNLRLALEGAKQGIRTIMVEQVPVEERDFTGGVATQLWYAVREQAAVVRSPEEARDAVEHPA
jgi:cobalamin transport system ATP-binding protein